MTSKMTKAQVQAEAKAMFGDGVRLWIEGGPNFGVPRRYIIGKRDRGFREYYGRGSSWNDALEQARKAHNKNKEKAGEQ